MPAISTTDWLALRSRVDTLVTDPAMPVYDPGAVITPPSDATGGLPYLLLSDVPNDPQRRGIAARAGTGVDHVRTGTLMLTLQWPLSRAISHTQLREIAGQIAEHFPADTCMQFGQSRLRVTEDASVVPDFVEGAWRVAVVRVRWSSM